MKLFTAFLALVISISAFSQEQFTLQLESHSFKYEKLVMGGDTIWVEGVKETNIFNLVCVGDSIGESCILQHGDKDGVIIRSLELEERDVYVWDKYISRKYLANSNDGGILGDEEGVWFVTITMPNTEIEGWKHAYQVRMWFFSKTRASDFYPEYVYQIHAYSITEE